MFDVETFVISCRNALSEAQPMLAVKELVERAVADPDDVAPAVPQRPGVSLLHRSDDLTIISVMIPGGKGNPVPHDHRMWAVVGVYGGQEDNQFFRRAGEGLDERGGRSVHATEVLAMGDDTIHAIRNPLQHSALVGIHVYGGDLVATERSMWAGPDRVEQPYDESVVVGRTGFRATGS